MSLILSYIQDFFRNIDKWFLIFCAAFAALIIFFNYRYGIETRWLYTIQNRLEKFYGFFIVYAIAFLVPWLFLLIKNRSLPNSGLFWFFLLTAPAIFALKVVFNSGSVAIQENITGVWGRYAAIVSSLPSKLIIVLIPLFLYWKLADQQQSFWGLTTQYLVWKPYIIMLLIMVPLIIFASTQSDFLHTYPKLRQIGFISPHTRFPWLTKLIYEISYGIDFVTIELFFRGFLVLAFIKYAGPEAILPMAVFYCSIHFGKPVFECISSFFGGILLGIVVYRTQSVLGGLVVHLGIAWMMEVGGYLGNLWRK
ncbi:MAG: CPBP family intramembrane metalloprotease [Gemmatimonadaceae bacterium]|nr:CPBP family intramembrane metalloprotease [Chitinophagaceae bacterium]